MIWTTWAIWAAIRKYTLRYRRLLNLSVYSQKNACKKWMASIVCVSKHLLQSLLTILAGGDLHFRHESELTWTSVTCVRGEDAKPQHTTSWHWSLNHWSKPLCVADMHSSNHKRVNTNWHSLSYLGCRGHIHPQLFTHHLFHQYWLWEDCT